MKKRIVIYLSLSVFLCTLFPVRETEANSMEMDYESSEEVVRLDEELINIVKPAYDSEIVPVKSSRQYMKGYPDNTFRPEENLTRAQAAAIFARLSDGKEAEIKSKTEFSDVDENSWYSRYIALMSEKNMLKGYPDGSFRPEEPVTRAEFTAIASRFDLSETEGEILFTDLERENWAYNSIQSAALKGWIKGYPGGKFEPDRNITRAEVSEITGKLLNSNCKKLNVKDFKDVNRNYWAYDSIMKAAALHEN